MSDITSIQWADSTVNPIMGCGGCELFPKPGVILKKLDDAISGCCEQWSKGKAERRYRLIIESTWN